MSYMYYQGSYGGGYQSPYVYNNPYARTGLETMCAVEDRGQASWVREEMKITGEDNKPKYVALSACIHCRNGLTHNCPNAVGARPYF